MVIRILYVYIVIRRNRRIIKYLVTTIRVFTFFIFIFILVTLLLYDAHLLLISLTFQSCFMKSACHKHSNWGKTKRLGKSSTLKPDIYYLWPFVFQLILSLCFSLTDLSGTAIRFHHTCMPVRENNARFLSRLQKNNMSCFTYQTNLTSV